MNGSNATCRMYSGAKVRRSIDTPLGHKVAGTVSVHTLPAGRRQERSVSGGKHPNGPTRPRAFNNALLAANSPDEVGTPLELTGNPLCHAVRCLLHLVWAWDYSGMIVTRMTVPSQNVASLTVPNCVVVHQVSRLFSGPINLRRCFNNHPCFLRLRSSPYLTLYLVGRSLLLAFGPRDALCAIASRWSCRRRRRGGMNSAVSSAIRLRLF